MASEQDESREEKQMNYSPSTIARIGDIGLGVRVDTGVADCADLVQLHRAQVEDFNVHGTILLTYLFMEVAVVLDAGATLFQYTYSCLLHTGGAIAATKLGTVSASIASLTEGARVVWGGGAVAGANHQITGSAGVSDFAVGLGVPLIIGYKDAVSTIGHLTTTADTATGKVFHSLFYFPMSDGAYVEAAY
jgi:phosphohistidine swiveling domain-containing protein